MTVEIIVRPWCLSCVLLHNVIIVCSLEIISKLICKVSGCLQGYHIFFPPYLSPTVHPVSKCSKLSMTPSLKSTIPKNSEGQRDKHILISLQTLAWSFPILKYFPQTTFWSSLFLSPDFISHFSI